MLILCSDLFQEGAGGLHETDTFGQLAIAGLLLARGMSNIGKTCESAAGLGQENRDLRSRVMKFGCMLVIQLLKRLPGVIQRFVPCAALTAKEITLLVRQHPDQIVICTEPV